MKIFASGFEGLKSEGVYFSEYCLEKSIPLRNILMSYYYARNHMGNAIRIRDNSDLVLIDSGAHSFQFGKKVSFDEYTQEYARFIREYDKKNVVGYFEMDIENIIGYKKVLELRETLEQVSDKIIPVWHPIRGVDDYVDMCKRYSGKIVAVGGFKNTDIRDEQYLMFLKTAKKYGCKVHCLGMTRNEVLDKVPFDYTDSSTWLQATNFGHMLVNGVRKSGVFPRAKGLEQFKYYETNYRDLLKTQEKYERKWCKEK